MPLRDGFEDLDWWEVIDDLDQRLAQAILRCVGAVPLRPAVTDEIAAGFRSLEEWNRGLGEPDYSRIGVAIAYLFKHMALRVSSVVAALCLATRHGLSLPRRILDLGSGTDATRVALEYCLAAPHRARDGCRSVSLMTIERSAAMNAVAQSIDYGPGVVAENIVRHEGGLDLGEMKIATSPDFDHTPSFDLIVLSALLPFGLLDVKGDGYWNTFIWRIASLTVDPAVIIMIEPSSKRVLAHRFAAAFERSVQGTPNRYFTTGPRRDHLHHGLGRIVRPHQLRRLEDLLGRIASQLYASPAIGVGGAMVERMIEHGIDSWNPHRPEFLVITRVAGHADGFIPVSPRLL